MSNNKCKIERDIEELELLKEKLSQELDLVQERAPLETIVREVLNYPITASTIAGYKLSNLQSVICGDEKIYSAACNELNFHVSVTMNDDTVLNVNVVVGDDSPLREILSDLLRLARERCLYRVLQMIQQFVHLKNFRTKVFKHLSGKHFFHNFSNDHENEFGRPDTRCDLWVYQFNEHHDLTPILEMQWRFHWDKIHQSLAHRFFIKKRATNCYPLKIFLENLTKRFYSFFDFDEEPLMEIWCQLNEYVVARVILLSLGPVGALFSFKNWNST